jgi:hypothetical protein
MMLNTFYPRRSIGSPQHLPKVESILATTYQPVSPRSDFVVGLKNKLADPDYRPRPTISDLNFAILLGIALSTTVLLVLALLKLIGWLGDALQVVELFRQPLGAEPTSAYELRTAGRQEWAG